MVAFEFTVDICRDNHKIKLTQHVNIVNLYPLKVTEKNSHCYGKIFQSCDVLQNVTKFILLE